MSYEFNGTLFQTRATMCDAIAQEWMTAGGRNHRDEIDAACEMGATALATECISGWGLDAGVEDDGPTWMEQRECTRDDIVAAFERFIEDRPDTAVTVGNWTGQIDAARALMDDEIAESIHGTVDNDQDFVDAYSEAHRAKYGVDFVVN